MQVSTPFETIVFLLTVALFREDEGAFPLAFLRDCCWLVEAEAGGEAREEEVYLDDETMSSCLSNMSRTLSGVKAKSSYQHISRLGYS